MCVWDRRGKTELSANWPIYTDDKNLGFKTTEILVDIKRHLKDAPLFRRTMERYPTVPHMLGMHLPLTYAPDV